MDETVETTVEPIEMLKGALLASYEQTEIEPDLPGRVLHPNGTRNFPDGGAIVVRSNASRQGKYRYRIGADGVWTIRSIQAGELHGYHAHTVFFLKNTGTVDLDVTP